MYKKVNMYWETRNCINDLVTIPGVLPGLLKTNCITSKSSPPLENRSFSTLHPGPPPLSKSRTRIQAELVSLPKSPCLGVTSSCPLKMDNKPAANTRYPAVTSPKPPKPHSGRNHFLLFLPTVLTNGPTPLWVWWARWTGTIQATSAWNLIAHSPCNWHQTRPPGMAIGISFFRDQEWSFVGPIKEKARGHWCNLFLYAN